MLPNELIGEFVKAQGSSIDLNNSLRSLDAAIIACSGGIDSLLLSVVSCRIDPARFVVAHAISPAVPKEATHRVKAFAESEGWRLQLVSSGEFSNPRYLQNPVNRCYYCKSALYSSLRAISHNLTTQGSWALLSGANLDDLREYRPGLEAAKEFGVRHPFIEAGMGKEEIRAMARDLQMPFSELPASPCLASRLYTGTEVTLARLRAAEASEILIRSRTGIEVVRCRLRENDMLVEVSLDDQLKITPPLLEEVFAVVAEKLPQIASVRLDPHPYKSGRALLVHAAN